MILECPACGARYRLADDAIPAAGKTVRCARCHHNWFEARAPQPHETPPPPLPEPQPEPEAEAPARVHWAWTALSVVTGLALLAGAFLIQNPALPPLDVTRIPLVGDWLGAQLTPVAPPPVPLTLAATAEFHPLSGGARMVALTGTLTNPTPHAQPVPPITALVIDGARHAVYRWYIAAPVAVLPPGRSVSFDSSASGFPPSGAAVTMRFAAAP